MLDHDIPSIVVAFYGGHMALNVIFFKYYYINLA